MAKLIFNSGFFEEDIKEVKYKKNKSLKEQVENFINDKIYKQNLVECYDSETGETFFSTIEDDNSNPSVIITVNNKVVGFDYQVQENDIVNISYIPAAWDWWGALLGSLLGSLAGALYGATLGAGVFSWVGFAIGAIAGGIIGFFAGGLITGYVNGLIPDANGNYDLGKKGAKSPDVRGAENQLILNNPYPFVIGKHLITPYIAGEPYTEYCGENGKDAYISVLYCAGYAPLKLTDFKLGEQILAYNRNAKTNHDTVLRGVLHGTEENDTGDILSIWGNNDINLELIQPYPTVSFVKSAIYPEVHDCQEINANILYVKDDSLTEAANVVYKGMAFKNNYRTNTVLFSSAYPKKVRIVLDFPNGLYSSHTETSEDEGTKTLYGAIPMWMAIQWRPYNEGNMSSQSDGSDFYNWNNIYNFNGKNFKAKYTDSEFKRDIQAHKGNQISESTESGMGYFHVETSDLLTVYSELDPEDRDGNARTDLKVDHVEYGGSTNTSSGEQIAHIDNNNPISIQTPNGYSKEYGSGVSLAYLSSSTSVNSGRILIDENELVDNNGIVYRKLDSNQPPHSIMINSSKKILIYNPVNTWYMLNGSMIVKASDLTQRNKIVFNYNRQAEVVGSVSSNFNSSEAYQPTFKSTDNKYVDKYGNVYTLSSDETILIDNATGSRFVWNSNLNRFVGQREIFKSELSPYGTYIDPASVESNDILIHSPSSGLHVDYIQPSNYTVTGKTEVDETVQGEYHYSVPPEELEVHSIETDGEYYTGHGHSVYSAAGNWLDKEICNFETIREKTFNEDQEEIPYSTSTEGTSQIRLTAEIDISEYASQMVKDSNTIKGIEIRVIRVSPNYIDQTESNSSEVGAFSYSDLVKVALVDTVPFDIDQYNKNHVVEAKNSIKEEDTKKFCYIAISAKADESGRISNQLEKLNCIAESFSPYWDDNDRKWMPENIHRYSTYYGYFLNGDRVNKGEQNAQEIIVEKAEYEQARRDGFDWIESKQGSTFGTEIIEQVLNHDDGIDSYIRTDPDSGETLISRIQHRSILRSSTKKYLNNSVSSGFMLACVGQHNGRYALGYENIDLLSVVDWWASSPITDGSTDESGALITIPLTANGYVLKSTKFEDLLKKITIAGRAVYTYDSNGKIKVIMDKPVKYPDGVINQQNCISQSNSFNYSEPPAGLRIEFSDENDGYEINSLYCWADGNSESNYKGQVDSYSLDFVTNPRQMWSLGRYFLACSQINREIVTAKIGAEAKLFELGDVVLVQSDELLIGEGSGRIQELIEENGVIYGFVSDSTYEYTGELDDDDNIKQGVTILQPKKYGNSRAVTLRLHTPTAITCGGQTYSLQIGTTNVVLFENSISRDLSENTAETINVEYNFTTDDICMFGEYTQISSKYRISKIKPEKDRNRTLTLIPYDEAIYNYGKQLPNYKPSMTIPPTELDFATLSDVPTNIRDFEHKNDFIRERIDQVENEVEEYVKEVPLAPTSLVVKAFVDRIELSCEVSELLETKPTTEWEVKKSSDGEWSKVDGSIYYFDRNVDLYPERDDLNDWTFRVRAVSPYNKTSAWVNCTINLDSYGTWHIPTLTTNNINKQELDRTVLLKMSVSNPSGMALYGNTKFKVSIKRTGYAKARPTDPDEDYEDVTPDENWYKPDLYSSAYDSETAYRTNDINGFVTSDGAYSQTLPLAGQSENKGVNTTYSYKIVAYNESGYETNAVEISATALCTSIRDIVKANANYKDLYVEKLSAIVANVGLINQGGFGNFENWTNFWALSDIPAIDAGTEFDVVRGTFKVGDGDEYISVTPVKEDGTPARSYAEFDHYAVEIKAGDISISNTGLDTFGTYIYQDSTRVRRLALTPNGIIVQNKVGGIWIDDGQFIEDSNNNMIIANTKNIEKIGILINDSVVYHFDTNKFDENNGNAESITTDGDIESDSTAITGTNIINGEVAKNLASSTNDVFSLTKTNALSFGETLINDEGTVDDSVKDLNDSASTNWGLTSAQVSVRLFKY